MAMYIYRTDGCPVGFRFSDYIHDLDGAPLGRVFGTHVHRFDGSYVGELFKDSVVDKPVPMVRSISPMKPPRAAPSPGPSYRRRGIVNYGYADLFHLLREGADAYEEPMAIAAE